MTSSFRYTDDALDDTVKFHIFSSHDGTARANVKGPVTHHLDNLNEISESAMAMPLAKAFAYAIRMANRNDVEIVVSGDSTLWDHRWGSLS